MCSTGCCGNGYRSTTRHWRSPATATGYWRSLIPAWCPEPLVPPNRRPVTHSGFSPACRGGSEGSGEGFSGLLDGAACWTGGCWLAAVRAAGGVDVVQGDHSRSVPGSEPADFVQVDHSRSVPGSEPADFVQVDEIGAGCGCGGARRGTGRPRETADPSLPPRHAER